MTAVSIERGTTAISGFVESLQEPRTPYISPKRFSAALGVQVAGLASLAGDHKTAAELVAEGHAEAVMAHLRDLENGASG